jgi:hypothetical protein
LVEMMVDADMEVTRRLVEGVDPTTYNINARRED